MYCNKCGAQNPDNSNFCSACGARINTQQANTQKVSEELYTLEIFRESQMFLVNPPINISIESAFDTKTLSINNGQNIRFSMPPGAYKVTFFQGFRKHVISINLNKNIHIKLKWNRLTGAIESNIT